MTGRNRVALSNKLTLTPAPLEAAPAEHWLRDDDELLLLDELEETDEAPDDERAGEVM